MKTTPFPLLRLAPTALLAALFLACPPVPLHAGDEGGWLPGQAGGVTEGSNGDEDDTESMLGQQVVAIASPEGLVEEPLLQGATLEVTPASDLAPSLTVESTTGGDAPITAASWEPIWFSQGLYGSLGLQGTMAIQPDPALHLVLKAAPFAAQRQTILMLHEIDGELPALADVLAGQVPAAAFAVTGDVPELDVEAFASLVQKHGEDLPGVVATWAFVAVDADGDVSVSGVRASTDGTVLEVHAD